MSRRLTVHVEAGYRVTHIDVIGFGASRPQAIDMSDPERSTSGTGRSPQDASQGLGTDPPGEWRVLEIDPSGSGPDRAHTAPVGMTSVAEDWRRDDWRRDDWRQIGRAHV